MEKAVLCIGNYNIDVVCEDSANIKALANKVNQQLSALHEAHPNSSMIKLSLLTALALQHKVDALTSELAITQPQSRNDISTSDEYKGSQAYRKFIKDITQSIEKLAIKLDKV